jgi:hypothetical protein
MLSETRAHPAVLKFFKKTLAMELNRTHCSTSLIDKFKLPHRITGYEYNCETGTLEELKSHQGEQHNNSF